MHFEGKSGDQLTLNGDVNSSEPCHGTKMAKIIFPMHAFLLTFKNPSIQVRPAFARWDEYLIRPEYNSTALPTETNQTRLLLECWQSDVCQKLNNQNILSFT